MTRIVLLYYFDPCLVKIDVNMNVMVKSYILNHSQCCSCDQFPSLGFLTGAHLKELESTGQELRVHSPSWCVVCFCCICLSSCQACENI